MHESVQHFNTREFDHYFDIDGHQYWLPGIQMKDIVIAASFADLDDDEAKVNAFRDFMVSRVRSDRPRWVLWITGKSIRKAVHSLNPVELTRLFGAWSKPGTPSGEALGSPVSTPGTAAS